MSSTTTQTAAQQTTTTACTVHKNKQITSETTLVVFTCSVCDKTDNFIYVCETCSRKICSACLAKEQKAAATAARMTNGTA
ncbi:hypothetical protein LTS10_010750 [Elasticomyces elasticus]|nr:hypothetical protein LTS10_010750 [Elasticomyces elasticus]